MICIHVSREGGPGCGVFFYLVARDTNHVRVAAHYTNYVGVPAREQQQIRQETMASPRKRQRCEEDRHPPQKQRRTLPQPDINTDGQEVAVLLALVGDEDESCAAMVNCWMEMRDSAQGHEKAATKLIIHGNVVRFAKELLEMVLAGHRIPVYCESLDMAEHLRDWLQWRLGDEISDPSARPVVVVHTDTPEMKQPEDVLAHMRESKIDVAFYSDDTSLLKAAALHPYWSCVGVVMSARARDLVAIRQEVGEA